MELDTGPLEQIFEVLLRFIDSTLVPVIFAIAFIVFIWGVYTYFIAGAADEEKRKTGKTFVMYGLIGFFVMISLWGIVNLFLSTLSFQNTRPCLPVFGGNDPNCERGSARPSQQNQGADANNPLIDL